MIAVIDENLPGRLVPWLLALGWQAVHVRELGFAGQADEAIWAWAQANGAIVITQDRDFDERAKAGGVARVLRLTLGNAPPAVLLAWLEQRWPQVEAWAGAREALLVLK